MTFDLNHPACVVQDRAADDFIIQNYVVGPQPSPLGRLYMFLHRRLMKTVPAGAHMMDRAARVLLDGTGMVIGISCLPFA
jgi:hypothetical protein